MRRGLLLAALAVVALPALTGCATRVKATATLNPPPAEAFSAFGRIEMKPVSVAPNAGASTAGVAKIQANLTKDLGASLETWNQAKDNGRRLVIEPVVQQMQFQRGAKRILLGPFAGSSGVLLELKITDDQGRQIANPQFFQRADAMAAGWLFGVHDNLMLTRVANLASGYVISNYGAAKGGPTGADDKAVAAQ